MFLDSVADAFGAILQTVEGRDLIGTEETPGRFARAWEELTSGYDQDIAALMKTFPSEGYDEMIACSPINFVSLCEHHALAFTGQAHVVYIPNGKIIGLSKIPRLVDAFARRLQVQERLTMQIADALVKHLEPIGVLVLIEAEHSCATLRGARSHGLRMRTQTLRGVMHPRPWEAFSRDRGRVNPI